MDLLLEKSWSEVRGLACGPEENCMLETKMWETVAGGDGGNALLRKRAQIVGKQAQDRTGQD